MVKRFTSWFKRKQPEGEKLDEMIMNAKNGNEAIRNQLLEQYKPFIKKCSSKATGRFISDSMDEFSVGLIAFNEAIDQFNQEQGHFLSFASVVIQRRVIDYIRKEGRVHQHIVYEQVTYEEDEINNESYFEQQKSMQIYEGEIEKLNRVEEIKEYQKLLSEYDITFLALSEQCPKHIDARENAKQIAKLLASDPELSHYLFEKKRLPIKKLEERVKSSRKTIERNRNYIIAVALIYIGGFQALQSYIAPEEGGE